MPMTKKEYYDLLVKTSFEGGFPATNTYRGPGPLCVYRTKHDNPNEARRFAVGILLSDQDYINTDVDPHSVHDFQGSADDLFSYHPKLIVHIPDGMHIADLQELQSIHDGFAFDASWNHITFIQSIDRLSCFHEGEDHS